jgi:chromosome partitioning protein
MNQKGGSGKTTTAVNLAAALGEKGVRVLLIDLDPQASATTWMGADPSGRGLADVFTANGSIASNITKTSVPGVDLVPASSWLVGIERALAGEVGAELVFRRALAQLPAQWDEVLVDCPPSLGLLSVSALTGCQHVLVPVEAHVMALAGLASLWQTVERVRERLNGDLAVAGILACRVDTRKNLSKDVLATLKDRFGDLVFTTTIRENVRLAEAPSFKKPVTLYDAKSSGAEDYRALAAEWQARIGTRPSKTPQPRIKSSRTEARI